MYDLGRRVWVKPLKVAGKVIERNYIGKPRHACYVVDMGQYGDFMCGSRDLRPADYECDGCGKWRKGPPHKVYSNLHIGGDDILNFCFLCYEIG